MKGDANVIDVLNAVLTAEAKGLKPSRIRDRYAARNAAIPSAVVRCVSPTNSVRPMRRVSVVPNGVGAVIRSLLT